MGSRAFWIFVGLFAVSAHASERIDLKYPGWTFYLDLRAPPYEPPVPGEPPLRHSLALRVAGKSLLAESGLRVPLEDSTFLSFEAAVTEWYADPAIPATGRRAFQAGVGVGVEF